MAACQILRKHAYTHNQHAVASGRFPCMIKFSIASDTAFAEVVVIFSWCHTQGDAPPPQQGCATSAAQIIFNV